ncbi:NADH:ubiquinone reductase (Na(+)-transporting) subunit C [uncultured Bacteroides sp.]|uniref:NADH:ubiquinone reductase (Na(+)-transporting) subunit C n=1 Tax=uncultured Bacteroides sp. TaxID=162156 RepID=UPI002AAB4352|nr:NADH:ubiquinone reductase (Na(+)-transporting) subunit C [uncultured Bacteroides sp.]
MNTNSNSYTIIYASVVVVIVAFVLAFTSASLKSTQNKNIELDKMKQILHALNVDTKGQNPEEVYNKYVKADQIMNANGEVLAQKGGFKIELKAELAKVLADRKLPLYVCEVDGQTKYVFPLYGAGLWGPIWGYVGLNDDKNSVYGVYFSHEGETPGLGAEIASAGFQKQFPGKHVLKDGAVELGVEKNGKVTEPDYQVDGISGGTITSKGVDAMLKKCLGQYDKFLTTNDKGGK